MKSAKMVGAEANFLPPSQYVPSPTWLAENQSNPGPVPSQSCNLFVSVEAGDGNIRTSPIVCRSRAINTELINRGVLMSRILTVIAIAAVAFPALCWAQPTQWTEAEGGNGHWYELAGTGTATWDEARVAAESAVFNGTYGHLLTVGSQAENDWVWNTLHPIVSWIGASQPAGSPEPAGGWEWVTGEPWLYANWCSAEPSNTGGNENAAGFTNWSRCPGGWNDASSLDGHDYVIEWETSTVPVRACTWGLVKGMY